VTPNPPVGWREWLQWALNRFCAISMCMNSISNARLCSEPAALLAELRNPAYRFKRIGLEAGPLSQWLLSALAE
jgi:transposase